MRGAVTPRVANAAMNAGGKLLKMVEMTHRYGKMDSNGHRTLTLSADAPAVQSAPSDPRAQRIKELETELASLR